MQLFFDDSYYIYILLTPLIKIKKRFFLLDFTVNNIILKIMLILMSMLFSTMAYAQVQIINPGSQEGVFRQILSTIGDSTDHNFVQADNPVTAYTYIEGAEGGTEPILTIWSSEWPGDDSLKSPKVSKDNIVALMTYETLMCSRAYNSLEDMSGQTVKIATWGSEPVAKFLKNLGAKYNVNFVVVPYSGSGSTTKGYVGKDADTVFTITSRQAALEEDGSKCIAFSEKGQLLSNRWPSVRATR